MSLWPASRVHPVFSMMGPRVGRVARWHGIDILVAVCGPGSLIEIRHEGQEFKTSRRVSSTRCYLQVAVTSTVSPFGLPSHSKRVAPALLQATGFDRSRPAGERTRKGNAPTARSGRSRCWARECKGLRAVPGRGSALSLAARDNGRDTRSALEAPDRGQSLCVSAETRPTG